VKKGLFLYGINCTLGIWDEVKDAFSDMDVTFVEYPHEITKNAHQVSDITKWVYETYGNDQFDFIVGHSMGGLVALELVARYKVKCDSIIFIESNLRPAKEFYRNLMLPTNMVEHGEKVKSMFISESSFYTDDLKKSIQTSFDFSPYISKISGRVYGIYGDRGIENYSGRIADLCLDKTVEDKINFKFVRNSCHLPMIENPQELASILRTCLK
jgi:pimeloyl-ACP methyl ester carboxylesterase